MTLFGHETTVSEAIEGIKDEIDEIDAELETVAPEATAHAGLVAAKDNLDQQRSVFEAYVAQGEWSEDDKIVLSSVSAGERAIVNDEMQDNAGRHRRTLWTVAAATDQAPWADDTIAATFANAADLEAPVVDWAETVIGGLQGKGHPLAHLRRTVLSQQSASNSDSGS